MIWASTLATAALILSLPTPVRTAPPRDPLPESLTGTLVSIADGDTITVFVGGAQHKIRLAAIDCPEPGRRRLTIDNLSRPDATRQDLLPGRLGVLSEHTVITDHTDL
jgi:endonuclease YncB( thermonuclease family)